MHPEVHVTRLNAAVDPAPHPADHGRSNGTDQHQEPERIGKNAGGDEEYARDDDDESMQQLLGWQATGGELGLDGAPAAKPFSPGKPGSRGAGPEDKKNGRSRSDQASQADERVELDQRDEREEQKKSQEQATARPEGAEVSGAGRSPRQ